MNTVVFGIGNRMMMDDGIGVYVVEELINNYIKENVIYVIGETDVDYCLDFIDRADKIIIIDSLYRGDNPGTIKNFQLHENDYKVSSEKSLHNTNLIDIIENRYKSLNGIVIGVEAFKIDYGMGLSDILKGKFWSILNNINKIINAKC